ncbi:LacI family DNA-binding transcriptional regulator [Rouxiella badensis]|jgi:LacI family asc operon transcriptional repressor|uniref:Transcriptional regulator n=1 Tax=Rouxiella badensis TaxID=1646377 RepID=A0A1X0WFI6_9GAMM|nr:LacI family DNA-binding transcriptional regulator [Rouxiella badensis]MCC3701776.1 LacI family transcriptional regulator [Rouxiella badensis]MCC3731418.1 LacI family transcriptional regulator [Rouxiella badensis]MCC3748825.1 LacI family transcriptional regulator [Rouxiella badensis]MCC3756807.1 LacI family transcriptional regulator [Rouxiella badensis]ORJ25515.1 transcriptional regulator [Rouxiella badensis]
MKTMLDVANKAGVSKATVSRVLAGNSYVSKTTRDRVFKAVEEIGYRPNLVARNLATSKSQSIGLMVSNTLYNGPYFTELLFQTATLTESYGRQLILADGKHSAEEERQAIEFLLDLRCDGIIVYPRFLNSGELTQIIERSSKPMIVVNRRLEHSPQHCVYADHQQYSFNAVSHLIQCGHRDIAFISGIPGSPSADSRLRGYRQALEKHDIAYREPWVVAGSWSLESGREAAKTLLARNISFSALVASNDDMAIGAANQLHAVGKRVPHDVSLIGFDDIKMASYFIPALSTVRVPVAEMIETTLKQLVDMMDGRPFDALQPFPGELIVRDSSGPGPHL